MDLQTILAELPDDRRDAVADFLRETVADCYACGDPVTRTQPRQLHKTDGIRHLTCPTGPAGA